MELELATTDELVAELFNRFELACFAGRKGRFTKEISDGDGLLMTHQDVLGVKTDGSEEVVDLIDGLRSTAFNQFLESTTEDDDE